MQYFPSVRQTAHAKMFDLMRHSALSKRAAAKRQCALADKDADHLKSRALASLGVRPAQQVATNFRLGQFVLHRLAQLPLRKIQRHPILQSKLQ